MTELSSFKKPRICFGIHAVTHIIRGICNLFIRFKKQFTRLYRISWPFLFIFTFENLLLAASKQHQSTTVTYQSERLFSMYFYIIHLNRLIFFIAQLFFVLFSININCCLRVEYLISKCLFHHLYIFYW